MEQQRTTGRPQPRQLNPEAKRTLIESAPAGIAAPVQPESPAEQAPPVQPAAPAPTPAPATRAQRVAPPSRSGRQRRRAPPRHPFVLRIPEDMWHEADRQAADLNLFTHEYILEALAERVERGRKG